MSIPKRRASDLDAFDHKILAAVHRDGRISKTKMSVEVGLSATRCWERMQRMEKDGIIRGYHADIDLKRLSGLSFFMVQVTLNDSSVARARQFERLVANVTEIVSVQAVLGTVDYFLIVAASGVESYQRIIEDLSNQETVKFEFVTFPISKTLKTPFSVPLSGALVRRA
jgi:Lrp/AsnC family transcriptional regulator, regulator of ectoine-degradation genes